MQISGSSAVVFGGAGGLGEATVRRLHGAGVKVVIADLADDKGKELAGELGVPYERTDVTNDDDVNAAIDAAEALGPFRISVDTHGGPAGGGRLVGKDGSPLDMEAFTKTITFYLTAVFNVMRHAAAAMARQEPDENGARGVIINTASIAAFDGQIGQAAYSASKGGVVGMTLPIARDLSRELIRVMTIAPGLFKTPLLGSLPEEAQKSLGKQVPHPARLGDPDEYGALAVHIVENPMLNGEVIRLDGAIRMAPR
jgi:NAD(P)-dependent dehydrogenase (short-subunit alcohol dehydrogenase family)